MLPEDLDTHEAPFMRAWSPHVQAERRFVLFEISKVGTALSADRMRP